MPFPFDDLSTNKVRPAVCLTEPIGPYEHIVLAFITSRVSSNPLETDLIIQSSDPNFASTGLHASSMLQLHRMTTVTKTVLKRELGTLPLSLQAEMNARLRKLFGLK